MKKSVRSNDGYRRIVDNKMRYYGDTDLDKHIIRVNKSKKKNGRGDIIDTIVHEEMHAKHPKMYERTVRRKTASHVKKLTTVQKHRLYNRYK